MSVLLNLDDKAFFIDCVTKRFARAASDLIPLIEVDHELDPDRLEFAHAQYLQNLENFTVLLQSENPDHYKRSGALLHALYKSDVATGVAFSPDKEEIEGGFTRIHYHDGIHAISMMDFYDVYHNEIVAFDLAYDFCASYEDDPVRYDFDFLLNISRYLKSNSSLCLDSCFMLLKALMQKS